MMEENSKPEHESPDASGSAPEEKTGPAAPRARRLGLLLRAPSGHGMPWEGVSALAWANRALAVACAVVTALLVWYVIWWIAAPGAGRYAPGRSAGPAGVRESAYAGPADSAASGAASAGGSRGAERAGWVSAAGYQDKIRQDLFSLGQAPQSLQGLPLDSPQPGDLRLQGVIIGRPSQAIIYDARMGVTYTVGVGDQIGEMSVERIEGDLVVISFRGEELDLKL
jgi:hypothetical protein